MAGVIVAYNYQGKIPGIRFDIHKSIELCTRLGLTVYLETDINEEFNCNKFNYESSIFSSYEQVLFIYTGHGENGNFDIRGTFLNMNDYILNICKNNISTSFVFILDCCNINVTKSPENAIIITSTNLNSIINSSVVGSPFIKLLNGLFSKPDSRNIEQLRKQIKTVAPTASIITNRDEMFGWMIPGKFEIDMIHGEIIVKKRFTGEMFKLEY